MPIPVLTLQPMTTLCGSFWRLKALRDPVTSARPLAHARTLVPLIVFAACIPLAFILPSWMGGMLFFLIFLITPLARRWALRGHADQAGDAA